MTATMKRELTAEQVEDAARLRALWEDYRARNRGATQVWLAKESGVGTTQGIAWQYLNAHIPLNLRAALGFARALGAPVSAFSPRLAAELQAGKLEQINDVDIDGAMRAIRRAGEYGSVDELPEDGFVHVPRIKLHTAPPGRARKPVLEEIGTQPMAVDVLRRIGAPPPNLRSTEMNAGGMERTLTPADCVLIDVKDTMVEDGKIYAIVSEQHLTFRRLFHLPGGGLKLGADNPLVPAIDLTKADVRKHIHVIGRARFRSGPGDL